MLYAATAFFLSLEELKREAPTITPFVKKHIFVDGRFIGFNYPSPLSDDGSREFIKSLDNAELIDAPDLREVEKRQVYLDKMKEYGDLLLVLDSDEYVELEEGVSWEKFIEFCEFEYENNNKITTQFGVKVENANTPGRNQFDMRPRVFANPWDIKHLDNDHKNFSTKEGKPVGISCNLYGIKIRHNYNLRNDTYMQHRINYQEKLVKSES